MKVRESKMSCFGHAADTTIRLTAWETSGADRPRKDQTGRKEGHEFQHVTHAAPPMELGMGTFGPPQVAWRCSICPISLAIFDYRRTRVEDLDADINSASCEKYE